MLVLGKVILYPKVSSTSLSGNAKKQRQELKKSVARKRTDYNFLLLIHTGSSQEEGEKLRRVWGGPIFSTNNKYK